MSPGDASFDEPYFYAYPYPAPVADALPEWSGPGRWHCEGFTALVLTATELVASAEQADTAGEFMTGALETCRGLVS